MSSGHFMTADEFDRYVFGMALGASLGGAGLKNAGKGLKVPPKVPVNRPTWRASELYVGKQNPGYTPQKPFLYGQTVPPKTSGCVIPDFYKKGNFFKKGHVIEVKNYNLETLSGQSNLVYNVSGQVNQRIAHLPKGTKQTIQIDIRGQSITKAQLETIKKRILQKCNIKVEIEFIKEGEILWLY